MQGPNDESGGGRDLTMTTALWMARAMHFDLTICNATAWDWWTAVSREDYKDGLLYTDYRDEGAPVTIIPRNFCGPLASSAASCVPAWFASNSMARTM